MMLNTERFVHAIFSWNYGIEKRKLIGKPTAAITSIIVPGEDEESTEDLRTRYFASLNPVAFGGVADYKVKVDALQGVGGVKVYPIWNGGGTVKISFISSDYGAPSTEQITEVQTEVDPTQNAGEII